MGAAFNYASRRAIELALCAAVLGGPAPAAAQTAIKGSVTDRVTLAPLAGAAVEVRRGGDLLGRAISNAGDGSFLITVEVGNRPEATNLKMIVSRDGYQSADNDIVVVSSRPRPVASDVTLLRAAMADCLTQARKRWVVVGHFRPPLGMAGGAEFASRVTDAVRWELAKIAETSTLAAERRPFVVPCEGIDERDFLSAAARELRADVLLSGGVSRPPNRERFTVSMFLADQHGLFNDRRTPILSRDVDLEDPSASRLDVDAAAAIVQAVLTGYLKEGRFDECVELSRRAAAELKAARSTFDRVSAECARQLPANGLRGSPR